MSQNEVFESSLENIKSLGKNISLKRQIKFLEKESWNDKPKVKQLSAIEDLKKT